MNQAAEVLVSESVTRSDCGTDIPTADTIIYTDSPRSAFVEKMRELATRVESGALNGASCQWNDNPDQPAMVYVEAFPVVDGQRTTRLVRVTFEKPESRMRLVAERV
jgi:hypothetical protein